ETAMPRRRPPLDEDPDPDRVIVYLDLEPEADAKEEEDQLRQWVGSLTSARIMAVVHEPDPSEVSVHQRVGFRSALVELIRRRADILAVRSAHDLGGPPGADSAA